MSDEESAPPPGQHFTPLTAEEKEAKRLAKQAKKAAKLATMDPAEAEAARLRAARIKERDDAKKARQKEKKAKQAEQRDAKRAASEMSAGAEGGEKKSKKKAKKKAKGGAAAAAPAPSAEEVAAKKAAKAARMEEQLARQRANLESQRQQNKAALAGVRLLAPFEVYLKYLPPDCTEAMVTEFFDKCGEIVAPGPKLMKCHTTGRVIRGFTTFATEAGCRNALALDLERLGTRSVSITLATTTGTMQAEGTHTPAMYGECVRHMGVSRFPNGVFVDGTFGRGGHTRKILEALGPGGQLHAFDMDEEAVVVGRQLEVEDSRFHMHHAAFSQMAEVLKAEPGRAGGAFVNGVLIDIGISSPQLDGGRGFRPEFDGPLDMRFDMRPSVENALQYVQRVGRHELAAAIEAYGGEHPLVARRIADAVALAKAENRLPERTQPFARLVADAKGREYQQMHPAKMTFQALRIVVNREYDELRGGLAAGLDVLANGGKLAIITWKHTECAIVVDFSRRTEVATAEAPLRKWYEGQLRGQGATPLKFVAKQVGITVEEARRPTAEEIKKNSRSRSAVLHILRRETGHLISDLEEVARPVLGWDEYPDEHEVFVPSSAVEG